MAYINGKKVLQMVKSAGGGGTSSQLLTTTTDATESSGTYTLALTYLSDTPNVDDYVAYIDSGAITTLYQVSAVGETNAILDKIGDIGGGGSQLYEHNIYINGKTQDNSITRIFCKILTDNNVPFTYNSFKEWLYTNGFVENNSAMYGYECNGYCGGNAVVSLRSQYYEGGYYLYMYTTDTWQKQFYALTDFNDSKIRAL